MYGIFGVKMTKTNDLFWSSDPAALKGAQSHAHDLKRAGNALQAHSEMLSAYYSLMSSVPIWKRLLYFNRMRKHARCLYENWMILGHNQLDVLIQFYIATHRKYRWLAPTIDELFKLAGREIALAEAKGKPHQQALAYTTMAQIARVRYDRSEENIDVTRRDFRYRAKVFECVQKALGYEDKVLNEQPRAQALRQWTRVLKYSGQVLIGLNNDDARQYLEQACVLALGAADTQDQVKKIQALLNQI